MEAAEEPATKMTDDDVANTSDPTTSGDDAGSVLVHGDPPDVTPHLQSTSPGEHGVASPHSADASNAIDLASAPSPEATPAPLPSDDSVGAPRVALAAIEYRTDERISRGEPGTPPVRQLRVVLSRAAITCAVATLLLGALLAGARLRVWAWEATRMIPPATANAARGPQSPAFPPGGPGGRRVGRGRPGPGGPSYGRMGGLRSGDVVNGYTWGSKIYNAAGSAQAVDWRGHREPSSWRDFFKAYLAIYDNIEESAADGKYQLDYAPGRLLTMALWVRQAHVVYPQIETWQPEYTYTAPVLRFNTCCELLAAFAGFFLVEHWVRRGKTVPPRAMRNDPASEPIWDDERIGPTGCSAAFARDKNALLLGLLAALLIWFNPATLVDAHVWPQWDVWLMPFYLWALYLGSVRQWFGAGALLGVGIMFKGQLLFGVPILLLWPLFAGQWRAMLSCLVGFLSAVALVAAGWLLNGHLAWGWIGTVVAFLVLLAILRRAPAFVFVAVTILGGLALYWPWLLHDRPPAVALTAPSVLLLTIVGCLGWSRLTTRGLVILARVFIAAVAVKMLLLVFTLNSGGDLVQLGIGSFVLAATVSWLLGPTATTPETATRRPSVELTAARRRVRGLSYLGVTAAATFAMAVFGAAWIFHGSMGWFNLGFGYGTYKHLAMSNNSSNLPAILNAAPYNWNLQDIVCTIDVAWAHVHWPVPMRTLLGLSFFTAVLLACVAAGRKDRRNDPTILLTFIVPWILLFTVMPQMHQRYLMWAAAFSATLVGVSLGMTLLHLLISGLATIMILRQLLVLQPDFAPDLAKALTGIHPAIGWMVAVIAAVIVYFALMPSNRARSSAHSGTLEYR